MNQGTVVGGWEYVWMAYSLTAAVFLIYGITLLTRLREERSRAGKEGSTS